MTLIRKIISALAAACLWLLNGNAKADEYTFRTPQSIVAQSDGALTQSCQIDFSSAIERPAGGHGYLTVGKDGHFHWGDGTRARFWGVNISSTRLNLPDDEIEKVTTALARASVNMVRLEAIDNRNCLLGRAETPDSFEFDAHYLDRLDRWMDALARHGIYYYLDLLDFRTFKPGDKVVNAESMDRAARPYAIFDAYLIQLQQEYAQKLLTHVNPYSHMRPIDDRALALVEICNEHGMFLYPEKLEKLVEPYNGDLHQRWCQWLHDHYGTTQNVNNAWATVGIPQPLRPDESLEQNTVDLPMFATPPDGTGRSSAAPRRTPGRLRDGVAFLAWLQRDYCKQMKAFVRNLGLHVPVTAVVSGGVPPDLASVASECDFTAENWYGETDGLDPNHPSVRFVGGRNPLRSDSPWGFAPAMAALKWNGKPVVVREWGASWPNRLRAASVPEALAYSALQDFDALLLFGYQTNTDSDGSTPDRLNDLAFQCDPTVWGLFAMAGQAFLKGAIHPAPTAVTLCYPDDRLNSWPNHTGDAYRLAWSVRVNSVQADKASGDLSFVPTGTKADLVPMRAILSKLNRDGVPLNSSFDSGLWRSETSEITLFSHQGRLEIEAPSMCAVAGELEPGAVYDLGVFRFSTPSKFGAIMALALDGKQLAYSHHILVKMVSRAENTGEVLEKSPPHSPDVYVLRKPGTPPVITFGRASRLPARVWYLPGVLLGAGDAEPAPYLELGMVDGSWELEITDGKPKLTCDTPDIAGSFSTVPGAIADRAP